MLEIPQRKPLIDITELKPLTVITGFENDLTTQVLEEINNIVYTDCRINNRKHISVPKNDVYENRNGILGLLDNEKIVGICNAYVYLPEMFYYPKDVIDLTEYFVEWINKGAKIVIYTHSYYLIKALNNLIMLAAINDNKSIFNYKNIDFFEVGETVEKAKNITEYGIDCQHFDLWENSLEAKREDLIDRLYSFGL